MGVEEDEVSKVNKEVNKKTENKEMVRSEKRVLATNMTNTTESEWGSCRSEAWHCFSSNMEEGVRNLHRPNDLVGSVQHLLYKAVFHGGLKSMWSSVMELPSARGLGSCLSGHDRCIEHSVLAREVDSAGW